VISSSQWSLPDNSQHSKKNNPSPWRDSNPQIRKPIGLRPTPYTARQPCRLSDHYNYNVIYWNIQAVNYNSHTVIWFSKQYLLHSNLVFLLIYVSEQLTYIVTCGADTQHGSGSPHSWGSPQSVGLFWTSDQLVAETCTWQHTTSKTKTKNISSQWGTRNHKMQNRLAEDQRLRLHGRNACYQRRIYYKLLFTTIFKQSITIHIPWCVFRIVPTAIKFNFFLIYVCDPLTYFSFLWPCHSARGIVSSFLGFVVQTQRRFAVCRTTLSEWLARRRNLYLTTHNSEKKKILPLGGNRT